MALRWLPRRTPQRSYWSEASRAERMEGGTAAVSVVVSAVWGRRRADTACVSMRWQVGLGRSSRPGILGFEGRTAVEIKAAAVKRRVMVSAVDRMMNGWKRCRNELCSRTVCSTNSGWNSIA